MKQLTHKIWIKKILQFSWKRIIWISLFKCKVNQMLMNVLKITEFTCCYFLVEGFKIQSLWFQVFWIMDHILYRNWNNSYIFWKFYKLKDLIYIFLYRKEIIFIWNIFVSLLNLFQNLYINSNKCIIEDSFKKPKNIFLKLFFAKITYFICKESFKKINIHVIS